MNESLPPVSSGSESESADKLRAGLVADYLCATNSKDEEKALVVLRKDEFRLEMAGMMPEQRRFWAAVDGVPWEKVKEGGQAAAEVVLPALIGFQLAEHLNPEAGKRLAVAAIAGSVAMETLALGVYKAEKVAKRHPRAAVLAQAMTLSRLLLSHGGTVLGSLGIGLSTAETVDAIGRIQGIEQIISPAGAGGGEGLGDHHLKPVGGSGDFGALQPPADVAAANEATQAANGFGAGAPQPVPEAAPGNQLFHPPGGEIPAEDLLPQPGDAELTAVQQAAATEAAARQAAAEAATRVVEVQPGNTLTELVANAGGDPYGADFTNTVLQSADTLTGPQNPNRDMAQALIEFIKDHPDGVNWRDAINEVGSLAKETVGGVPLKDAIAQATRMIYPGQEMKVVVGAGV